MRGGRRSGREGREREGREAGRGWMGRRTQEELPSGKKRGSVETEGRREEGRTMMHPLC